MVRVDTCLIFHGPKTRFHNFSKSLWNVFREIMECLQTSLKCNVEEVIYPYKSSFSQLIFISIIWSYRVGFIIIQQICPLSAILQQGYTSSLLMASYDINTAEISITSLVQTNKSYLLMSYLRNRFIGSSKSKCITCL